ncbi:MAG: globin [Calditrichaeota bacterium]|nr:globin [Calditrichota bacterium]
MAVATTSSVNIQEIKLSLGRCSMKGDLFQRFYEIFFKSHPDIPGYFENTEMKKQEHLLKQGINLAIMHFQGMSMGQRALERIRETHNRHNLNIPPALYNYWKKSFLKAIEETDPKITPQLLKDWEVVLQNTVAFVTAGY